MLKSAVTIALMTIFVAGAAHRASASDLVEKLEPLRPFLGHWEIEATWESGDDVWAHAVYEPIIGGRFIESRTWVRDNGGDVYLRYHSILAPGDEDDAFRVYTFSHDGTLTESPMTLETENGAPALRTSFPMGEGTVEESIGIPTDATDDTSSWKVWFVTDEGTEPFMDDAWTRAPDAHEPAQQPTPLADHLTPLERMRGRWEIDTTWQTDGSSLWARMDCAPAPGGEYVHAHVWARDDDGPMYHRYRIFMIRPDAPDPGHEFMFTYRGEIIESEMTLGTDGPGSVTSVIPHTEDHPARVVKSYAFSLSESDDVSMDWTVDAQRDPDGEAMRIIEGRWHRVAERPIETRPIDPARFVGAGMNVSRFAVEQTIDAPLEDVYGAFTDPAAFASSYGPDMGALTANIDPAIGGRYEWLWDGVVGSNGCQVLSYIPNRMISFSWNAPPGRNTRDHHTWVVVEFDETNAGVRVRLTHLGFGRGEEWNETSVYFEQAWRHVLQRFRTNLESRDDM